MSCFVNLILTQLLVRMSANRRNLIFNGTIELILQIFNVGASCNSFTKRNLEQLSKPLHFPKQELWYSVIQWHLDQRCVTHSVWFRFMQQKTSFIDSSLEIDSNILPIISSVSLSIWCFIFHSANMIYSSGILSWAWQQIL